ncbi:glutathione S-transferase LANCL1-like [Argopecten irradians]|uniref:glutathione S-transferase LANCL1-like n=1 Tax=Argopecten irradians TaxID=31199 RepID=UPI0037111615
MSIDGRAFANKFVVYDGKPLVGEGGKLLAGHEELLQPHIDRLLKKLYTGLNDDTDTNYSMYTGIGGIAYLHWHMYHKLGKDPKYLGQAYGYIKHHLRHLKGRRVTFLCGDAGPLALGAVICSEMGKADKAQDLVKRLEAMHEDVCSDRNLPDEILFGRSGYLFALLFVQRHLGDEKIDNSVIYKVFQSVIDRGRGLSREEGFSHPLMYRWHDRYYLGAAHGLAGILNILMQVPDPTGKLIGKIRWYRQYLYLQFAQWCGDYGKHGCRTPDTPFSLFEGMAGTIYFLIDILDPSKSHFPAFEL